MDGSIIDIIAMELPPDGEFDVPAKVASDPLEPVFAIA
jgi:hypothetical protein